MEIEDLRSFVEVADAGGVAPASRRLGIAKSMVSRRLARVRDALRARLEEVVATYSFTPEELAEPERKGIALSPSKRDDAAFDEAVGEVYRRYAMTTRQPN